MVLNKVIADSAYMAFRRSQIKAMESERMGIIHVSDLLKECDRYTLYQKLEPMPMSTEEYKSLWYGQLVHSNSMMSNDEKYHELFFAYDYVNDISISYEDAKLIPKDDPRQLDIIYGSMDDLLEVDGELVICDKKTTGSIDYFKKEKTSANDNHKAQINMYRVLLNKCYGMDSKKGCVVYIPNCIQKGETFRIIPKAFNLDDPGKYEKIMIDKAKQIKKFYTSKVVPPPTYNFMCEGMCPHASKCFTEERVKFE